MLRMLRQSISVLFCSDGYLDTCGVRVRVGVGVQQRYVVL